MPLFFLWVGYKIQIKEKKQQGNKSLDSLSAMRETGNFTLGCSSLCGSTVWKNCNQQQGKQMPALEIL